LSKVQGKETGLLNNLSNSGIAEELDSRLRDLEKNISVAREFIKLADESYSELRHKWNLLQEEARTRPLQSIISKEQPITNEARETKVDKRQHRKSTRKTLGKTAGLEGEDPTDARTIEATTSRAKTPKQPDEESEITSKSGNSSGSEKSLRFSRDQNKKHRKSASHSKASNP
jgi:predicted nuclease with TOPRIM domain